MTRPLDVLAYLDARIASHKALSADAYHAQEVPKAEAVRAAVAEMVEADREYDAAYAAVGELRDGVSTIGEVIHAEAAFHRAQSRRATALARIGGAS